MDFATLLSESRIQENQDGQDFLSESFWKNIDELKFGTPEEYIRASSSPSQYLGNFKINDEAFDVKPCNLTDQLLQESKPSNDSDWIISKQTLNLLDNDPQEIIQCTSPRDRVLFALTGTYKFKRTLFAFHDLEFIIETPTTKEINDDGTGIPSFTCPDSSPFLITNSTFQASGFIINNCKASSGKGAIVILSGASAMFISANISNNTNRAFFVSETAQLTLKNLFFRKNNLNGDNGGVVFAKSHAHLTLLDSVFLENSAAYGGAIHAYDNNNVTIVNCTLHSNSALFGGAIYSRDLNNITVIQSSLNSNNASRNGGAIYSYDQNNLTITQSSLNSNNASRNGGAICFWDQNNLTITQSSLNSNRASYDGGAIYSRDLNNITVIQSSLNSNNASRDGGAICFWDQNNLTITQSSLNSNNASRNGGAIYSYDQNNLTITQSSLNSNNASESGGAIYNNIDNVVVVDKSKLNGNNAAEGGALYMHGDSVIKVSFTQLFENNATQGGAIYVNRNIQLSIISSNCTKNNASTGGCLFGDRSSLEFQGFECIENSSHQSGGCLHLEACSSTNLRSNNYSLNKAENGGGIYATLRTFLQINQAHFSSNLAEKDGGGLALIDDSTLFCLSCTFENNTAIQGGGLYIASNSTQILIAQLTRSTFQNNNASSYGGGILVKTFGIRTLNCTKIKSPCDRVVLFGVKFKNNIARFSSIIMATTPENVLVNCFRNFSMAYSLITRENIETATANNTLNKLDNEDLCSSWVKGWHLNDDHEVEIGTFGTKLNLTINSTSGSPIKINGNSRFELDVVRDAREFPTIILIALDAFGNERVPLLFGNEALELSSSNGCIQKSVIFFYKNLTGTIPHIFEEVSMLECEVDIASREEDILQSVALIVRSDECGINEDLINDERSCHECREGLYNFQPKEGCKTCPEGAECNGIYIVPKEGYWHKSPCHSKVKQCVVEDACKAANRDEHIRDFSKDSIGCNLNQTRMEEYNDILCQEGYRGSLCGRCKESYGLTSSFECKKCKHFMFSILNLLAITLYLLLSSSLTIMGVLPLVSNENSQSVASNQASITIEDGNSASPLIAPEERASNLNALEIQESNSNGQIEQESSVNVIEDQECHTNAPHTPERHTNPSNQEEGDNVESAKQKVLEAWKILLNFLQVTSIAALMEIKWTDVVLKMLQKLQFISAATLNAVSSPLDCILSSTSHATRAIRRVLFSLLVPTTVVAILTIHWIIRLIGLHRGEGLYFAKRFTLTIITVIYITYFDLTQAAVRVFNCVSIHDDIDFNSNLTTKSWIADTSIECYKGKHLVLVGIALVLLILVSIGYPLFCSYALYTRQNEVHRQRSWAHETLSFLCGLYKDRFIYWECITMLKKAFLSIIIVFSYSLGKHAQGVLIILVFIIFLYIHFVCLPYKEEYNNLNYYESGSLLASSLTYAFIQFLNVETYSELSRGFISASLIIVNVGYTCTMLRKITKDLFSLLRALLKSEQIEDLEDKNFFCLLIVYLKTRILYLFTSRK